MQKIKLVIFLVFISLTSFAQFSIGVKQGIGLYGIHLETGRTSTLSEFQVSYIRPSTGLIISYINAQNAGLQLEINYKQKGWKEVDDTLDGSFYTKTISYLEFPLLSHFEIGNGALRPTITAGFYAAYKLNETTDSANFSHIIEINKKYDHYSQEIRKLDFGIKLGVGLRYNINDKFGFFIEGRYDLDIAGGRNIFIDEPNGIQASRLKEISGSVGIVWHIIPQKKKNNSGGYIPKEDLYEN